MAENINLTLENLRAAIEDFTEQSGQCCTSKGQDIESPPSDGEVAVGPDEQFPDQESYFDGKCNASNAIYDQIKGTVTWLKDNNVDFLAGVFGGVTTALTMAVIISGPVGWALEIAAVVIVGLSTYLISHAINFEDLENAMIDVHSGLVLSLFNAPSTTLAKSSFLSTLEASSVPTTDIERGLVSLMLANDLLNQLFSPREDVAVYQSPSPINCPAAWSHTFDFTASNGGWTNDTAHSRPFGIYSAGVGWVSVWGAVGPTLDERLYLERTGVSGEIIQSVAVSYEFSGSCGAGRQTGIKVWDGATEQRLDAKTPNCGVFVHVGIFSDEGTIITTSAVGDADDDGDLEITITQIVVTGQGSDPF